MPLRKGRHPQIKEVEILKHKKIMILALALLLLTALCCTSALAAGGGFDLTVYPIQQTVL